MFFKGRLKLYRNYVFSSFCNTLQIFRSQSVSTAASYSPQQEEEYPFYNQDWNDRRRRLQRQRTRYVGRS